MTIGNPELRHTPTIVRSTGDQVDIEPIGDCDQSTDLSSARHSPGPSNIFGSDTTDFIALPICAPWGPRFRGQW